MNHDGYRNDASIEHFSNLDDLHQQQATYYSQKIHEAASDTQSLAELNYDRMGGAIHATATQLLRLGSTSVDGFMKSYGMAIESGKSNGDALIEAVQQAPTETRLIAEKWATEQAAMAGKYLTTAQQSYYKDQLLGVVPGSEKQQGTLSASELSTLSAEGPDRGSEIASLIHRAVSQNRPDLLNLIGRYNRSTGH
jgi:conjugal transfer mating pair stabilization protein TraG